MDIATEDLITKNRTYAGLLGWNPTDIGALTFDPLLVSMVRAQQHMLGIPDEQCDGVMGPATYDKLLTAKLAYVREHPRVANAQMTAAQARAWNLADMGQLAVWEIKKLWLQKIVDLPPADSSDYERCRTQIDLLVRTQTGLGWSWEPPYRPKAFKWCGTGPAYGYRNVVPLAVRQKWFASTYRFDRYFHYQAIEGAANPRPVAGPFRQVLELDESSRKEDVVFPDGTRPRAGDVALVGPHNCAYGVHIATIEHLVETSRSVSLITLEHNGTGYFPDGTRRHGIVRATRSIGSAVAETTQYIVRRIGRFAPIDVGI